jgi:DNA-binding NtrC family response regulator
VSLVVTLASSALDSDLDAHFLDHLSTREVALPKLADRAEDLRALALYELVRIGYGLRGKPMGLSLQAQELLNEHDWPGNDTELRATLLRAAHRSVGDVIETDELAAAMGAGELTKSGPQPRTGSS